jgi:hypothetical protein
MMACQCRLSIHTTSTTVAVVLILVKMKEALWSDLPSPAHSPMAPSPTLHE